MYSQQFAKSYKHGYYGFNAMVKIRNWLDFHQQQSKLCYRHVILVSQSPVRRPAQELTSVVNLPSPFSLYALVLTFTQYVILIRRQLFFRGMCRNICREDFGCHNLEMGATGIQWGRPRMLLTLYNDRKASHKKKIAGPKALRLRSPGCGPSPPIGHLEQSFHQEILFPKSHFLTETSQAL